MWTHNPLVEDSSPSGPTDHFNRSRVVSRSQPPRIVTAGPAINRRRKILPGTATALQGGVESVSGEGENDPVGRRMDRAHVCISSSSGFGNGCENQKEY